MSDSIRAGIFPRYGDPVQLVTDNGPGNVNRIMREILASRKWMDAHDHFPLSPTEQCESGEISKNTRRHINETDGERQRKLGFIVDACFGCREVLYK